MSVRDNRLVEVLERLAGRRGPESHRAVLRHELDAHLRGIADGTSPVTATHYRDPDAAPTVTPIRQSINAALAEAADARQAAADARDAIIADLDTLRGSWTGDLDGFLADRAPTLTLADLAAVHTEISDTYALQATLEQDYYTIAEADAAISSATTALKAEIEDPAGGSLGATLANDYLTAAETGSAISAARLDLEASLSGATSVLDDQFLGGPDWTRLFAQGTLTRRTNDIYATGDTWVFDVGAAAADMMRLRSTDAAWIGQAGAEAYVVEVDVTLISGSLDGAGVTLAWATQEGGFHAATLPLADHVSGPVSAGAPVRFRAVMRRPAGYTGTFDFNEIRVFANADNGTPAPSAKTLAVHRIAARVATEEELGGGAVEAALTARLEQDYYTSADTDQAISGAISDFNASVTTPEGTLTASVETHESAIATIDGNLSSLIAFRAQAGGAGALLELVAADDPGGAVSTARIAGDHILLDGQTQVDGDFLVSADAIVSGTMSAARVRVDEMMTIEEQAGFRAGAKESPLDDADGIYLGAPALDNGFAFALTHTGLNGLTESIEASEAAGVRLTNAQFYRFLSSQASQQEFLADTTFDIPPGTTTFRLEAVAAGGGGGGANYGEGASPGTAGGDTIVELRDGTTVVQTWTLAGGAGGEESINGDPGEKGENSVWGAGGAGGEHYYTFKATICTPTKNGQSCSYYTAEHHETPGEDATGFGAGGGGGGGKRGQGGGGGGRGQFMSQIVNVADLADPKLAITIGAAGTGGAGADGGAAGGDGTPGRVTFAEQAPRRADVIPLAPQAWGSMSADGPFPDLGAGFWVLSPAIGGVEINDSGETVSASSFVSSKTPVIPSPSGGGGTVNYQFFKMGD